MSEYVPIITTTLGARPEIASKLLAGLTTGEYERVGGIIRRVDTKTVVTWLRTVSEGQSVNMTTLNGLGSLLHLNIATSLLDLSISAIGFTLVLKRLISIEGQLEKITDILDRMNRKLDLSFYGNFRAALDLAHSAFRMREETNKRISATQAINRFLEAEHCFLGMVEDEIQVGSPAVSPFLSTLFLAYVSTAQCYLELGETETALRLSVYGL